MNATLTFGVPSLFEKQGDKRTTLYMVVSGHNSEKGEAILISRTDLSRLVVGLEACADMVDAPSINHALETGAIPAKNMEKLIRGLSSGLEFLLLAKGPGETREEKLGTFLASTMDIWEEMNAAESQSNPVTALAQFICAKFTKEQMVDPSFTGSLMEQVKDSLAEVGTIVANKVKENGVDPKGFVIYRKPRKAKA